MINRVSLIYSAYKINTIIIMKKLIYIIVSLLISYPTLADSKISVGVDNDFWLGIDQYYTHGWDASYSSNYLYQSFIKYTSTINPYPGMPVVGEITVSQKLFTPTDIDVKEILKGDRPYCSTLFAEFKAHKKGTHRKPSSSTSLMIGIMGPLAMGYETQSWIHSWNSSVDNEPMGWDNQIKNDIILNYAYRGSSPIFKKRYSYLNWGRAFSVGTYDTSIEVFLNTGLQSSPYDSDKIRVSCNLEATAKFPLYDGTLQGGLFTDSPYTIGLKKMEHIVGLGKFETKVHLYGFELLAIYNIISPQFNGADWYSYIRTQITYQF